MDDVVAARVRLTDGSSRYFMTWGRIQHAVDPMAVEQILWAALPGFALGGVPQSVQLCRSLQEAADSEFFFEALVSIAREPIPFGPSYQEWVAEKNQRMISGKDIWYLGASVRRSGLGDTESGSAQR